MKTNMKRTFVLCIALCLGLTSACVKVDVSVTSQDNSRALSPYPPMKPSILMMDDLKRLHTVKSCNRSSFKEVHKEQQQTVAWCWAASTRMVMESQNKTMKPPGTADPQCNIVMNILSNLPRGTNCCEEKEERDFIDAPSECVRGGWPHWILEKYGFSYETVRSALDWEALTGEICSIGPFISVIKWRGGGQHAFVVKGYHESKDFGPSPLAPSPLQFVEVYDPNLDDHLDMTLDEFEGDSPREGYGFQRFSHSLDFVQILPKAKDHQ